MANAETLSISTPFGFWCNCLVLKNNSAAVWIKKASLQLPDLTTADDKTGALGGFNLARPVWLTPIIWRMPLTSNDGFDTVIHISSHSSGRAAFVMVPGQQSAVAPREQWHLPNGLPGCFPCTALLPAGGLPSTWHTSTSKLSFWGWVVMSARYILLYKVEPKPAASCCLA